MSLLPMRALSASRRFVLAGASALAAGWRPAKARPPLHVPRLVLAFYFGWYRRDFATKAHFKPLSGGYDSNDAAIVEHQFTELAEAGVSGVIASWWPQRHNYTDKQLDLVLPAAQRHGLKVSVSIEQFDTKTNPDPVAAAISDLGYVLQTHAKHPAYLKVDGRPVIFIYARAVHMLQGPRPWDQALSALRQQYGEVIILIDGQDHAHTPHRAAAFDGEWGFGFAGLLHNAPPSEYGAVARRRFRQVVADTPPDRISCLAVGPGYDDSQTKRTGPRPVVDRNNGETYRTLWREAIAANPDWILISTFNEWIEGSQIEPSVEFGDQALKETAGFAREFLQKPPKR